MSQQQLSCHKHDTHMLPPFTNSHHIYQRLLSLLFCLSSFSMVHNSIQFRISLSPINRNVAGLGRHSLQLHARRPAHIHRRVGCRQCVGRRGVRAGVQRNDADKGGGENCGGHQAVNRGRNAGLWGVAGKEENHVLG